MDQSINSVGVAYRGSLTQDPSREARSFRGLVIGIALSAVLWAPLGVVALRLL